MTPRYTAVFVENKILLKIVACLLAYAIQTRNHDDTEEKQHIDQQIHNTLNAYTRCQISLADQMPWEYLSSKFLFFLLYSEWPTRRTTCLSATLSHF